MLLSAIWDKDGLEALNIVLCNSFQVRQVGQFFSDFYERLGFGGILSIAVREQPLCVFSSSIPHLYLLSSPSGDNCHCPWGLSDS